MTGIGGNDELAYLALSQSLEQGSYRDIFKASAPYNVHYPPGYPAWLVLVRHTLGENLDFIRATNLALVALTLILVFAAMRRLAGPGLALALLLPLSLNQTLLASGGSLMSEPLYLFLSTAALVAALFAEGNARRRAYAVIGFTAVAFLTRSAGITLILATGVWLSFRRRRTELLTWAMVVILVAAGWFTFAAVAPRGAASFSYADDFTMADAPGGGPTALALRTWHSAVDYYAKGLPTSLSLPTVPGTVVDNLLWVGIITVLLVAGLIVLWARWRVAAGYLLLYTGLLLVWPWPVPRLLVPIAPIALLTVLLGANRVAEWLPRRARGPALGVLMLLLTLGAYRGARDRDAQSRLCDRANPYQSVGCYNAQTRGLAAMAQYLGGHSAPTDVVLTAKPASVYFLSGRRTEHSILLLNAPPGGAASTLRARNIRFVILVRMELFESRDLAPVLLASCREFRVEATAAPYALLLSTSELGTSTDDACSALADFIRAAPAAPHQPTP